MYAVYDAGPGRGRLFCACPGGEACWGRLGLLGWLGLLGPVSRLGTVAPFFQKLFQIRWGEKACLVGIPHLRTCLIQIRWSGESVSGGNTPSSDMPYTNSMERDKDSQAELYIQIRIAAVRMEG